MPISQTALTLCCSVVLFAAQQSVRPTAKIQKETEELLEQLDADNYSEREFASERLVELGELVQPRLEQALQSKNPEARRRVHQILADIGRQDYLRRLKAFANDLDGSQKVSLPGWERYCQVVGGDRDTREIFIEMQRAEPALLEAYENTPDQAHRLLAQRIEMYRRQTDNGREVPLGSVAAFLLVVGDAEVTPTSIWTCVFYSEDFKGEMYCDSSRIVLEKLLIRWIDLPINAADDVETKLLCARNHNLKKSGIALATKLVLNHPAVWDKLNYYRKWALLESIYHWGDFKTLGKLAWRTALQTLTRGRVPSWVMWMVWDGLIIEIPSPFQLEEH